RSCLTTYLPPGVRAVFGMREALLRPNAKCLWGFVPTTKLERNAHTECDRSEKVCATAANHLGEICTYIHPLQAVTGTNSGTPVVVAQQAIELVLTVRTTDDFVGYESAMRQLSCHECAQSHFFPCEKIIGLDSSITTIIADAEHALDESVRVPCLK